MGILQELYWEMIIAIPYKIVYLLYESSAGFLFHPVFYFQKYSVPCFINLSETGFCRTNQLYFIFCWIKNTKHLKNLVYSHK